MHDTDHELLGRYVAGDVSGLEALIERHRKPLYAFLISMNASQADADDVFQETWLRVIRHAPSFRRGSFRGWLFRIGRNLLVDRVRLVSREVPIDRGTADDNPAPADCLSDGKPDAAQEVGRRDLAEQVRWVVAKLPAPQREVFLLRMEAELSFKEIARIQKVSINTALARMRYAVEKVGGMLSGLNRQGGQAYEL